MTPTRSALGPLALALALAAPAWAQFGMDAPEAPASVPAPQLAEDWQESIRSSQLELVSTSGEVRRGLRPVADTLPIVNTPVPRIAPEGFCYGKARTEAIWFRHVVRAGYNATEADPVRTPSGEAVHRGNFPEHRIRRRYQARLGQAGRPHVLRVVSSLAEQHRYSALLAERIARDPRQREQDASWKVAQWKREIRRWGSSGLGMSFLMGSGTPGRHAVLLVSYERCVVRDSRGEHPATRFRIVDSAFIEGRNAPAEDLYLYYLEDEHRLSFAPGYIRNKRGLPDPWMLQVQGRVLDAAEVQYLDVFLEDTPYAELRTGASAD